MEKVSSTSPSAKIDVFETISSYLPIYTAHHFIPHLTELWKVIKAEIAGNPETELELACLKCLRDIAKALAHAIVISSDPTTPLSKFLHAIITECIGYFKGTETKYIKPCGKIIASLASSSLIAANIIGEKVFSLLFLELETKKTSPDKQLILTMIVDMIMSTRLVFTASNEIEKKRSPLYFNDHEKEKSIKGFVSILLSEHTHPYSKLHFADFTN